MEMTDFSSALSKIVKFLENNNIQYMLIGGIANSIYGEPRYTLDIEIKIKLNFGNEIKSFISDISKEFTVIPENPYEFFKSTMVLPLESDGIKIDIVVAGLSFETDSLNRAVTKNFQNIAVKVCTAEDLIIHKAISEREKDWLYIESIIKKRRQTLDWDFFIDTIKQLSEWLSDNEIYERIIRLKNEK